MGLDGWKCTPNRVFLTQRHSPQSGDLGLEGARRVELFEFKLLRRLRGLAALPLSDPCFVQMFMNLLALLRSDTGRSRWQNAWCERTALHLLDLPLLLGLLDFQLIVLPLFNDEINPRLRKGRGAPGGHPGRLRVNLGDWLDL